MKYKSIVMKSILSKTDWKSTSQIKKETEKKAGKSINWYTINYLLETLLKEKFVETIKSNNVTLWRRTK